jgi:hypothetical protein
VAALKPSGVPPGVFQRELQEFEGEFPELELTYPAELFPNSFFSGNDTLIRTGEL